MVLLFLCFIMFTALLIVLSTVFWIWMLVDCINNKSIVDSTKAVWVLLIIFTHFLGAFCYLLIARKPQPVIVYQYQQPSPFSQSMMGIYQPGNVPQAGGIPFYQAPFQPPYPAGGIPGVPPTAYQQAPQYAPYRPGKAQGEYIPYHDRPSTRPTEVLSESSYQDGYQPRPRSSEAPPRASAPGPWRPEDEPQAMYPELPQQESQQQPNID